MKKNTLFFRLFFVFFMFIIIPVFSLADSNKTYEVPITVLHYNDKTRTSMMQKAVPKKVIAYIKDGVAKVELPLVPINVYNTNGYLGKLNLLDNSVEKPVKVLETYDIDDEYTKKYNLKYPKKVSFEVPFSEDTATEQPVSVFVPVMEDIGGDAGTGTQRAIMHFDWANKRDITVNENTEIPVTLNIQDEGVVKPHVRRMVEDQAFLVSKDNKTFLRITYFSKQEDSRGYDNGSPNLYYSNEVTDKPIKLEIKNIEQGISGGEYILSQADVPYDKDKPLYLYGDFQATKFNPNRYMYYGKVSFTVSNTNTKQNDLEDLSLLSVKQGDIKAIKEKTNPLDFTANGKNYSPYTSPDGKHFKLVKNGENVQINLERPSFVNSDLRNIHFTLDGSLPTKDSPMADILFLNQDQTLPSKFFRLYIDPLKNKVLTSSGGIVTVTIQGFNKDYTKKTKPLKIEIPYCQETIDELLINNVDVFKQDVKLDTARNFALPTKANLLVSNINNGEILESIKKLSSDISLTPKYMTKISLINEDETPLTLFYSDGWATLKNPAIRMTLTKEVSSKLQAYWYENGKLRLLQSHVVKGKGLMITIPSYEGYLIIGDSNADIRQVALDELKNILNKAKEELNTLKPSSYAEQLKQEIAIAEKNMPKKFRKAYEFVAYTENIKRLLELAKANEGHSLDFITSKINYLKTILNNTQFTNLLVNEDRDSIPKMLKILDDATKETDVIKIQDKILPVENFVNEVHFRSIGEKVDVSIYKYDSDDISMANNIIEKFATRYVIDGKVYLVLDLKTMHFGNIKGHLLNLHLFRDKLDEENLNVIPISYFEDVNAFGQSNLYIKRLVLCLDNEKSKSMFNVRVENDAMGGAKPEARLIINRHLVNYLEVKENNGEVFAKLVRENGVFDNEYLVAMHWKDALDIPNNQQFVSATDFIIVQSEETPIKISREDAEKLHLKMFIKLSDSELNKKLHLWVQEDSKWKELEYTKEGNYIVFNPPHFSVYLITEDKVNDNSLIVSENENSSIDRIEVNTSINVSKEDVTSSANETSNSNKIISKKVKNINPKTGDDVKVCIYIIAISGLLVFFYNKKKNLNI